MRSLIAVGLLAVSTVAHPADRMFTQGANSVRLTEQACANSKILSYIQPGARGRYLAGNANLEKNRYEICWTLIPEHDAVVIIYEDGDVGVLPAGGFKPVKHSRI